MKNSLRMIAISIILWLGLGIVNANALSAPTTGTNSNSSSLSIATQSSTTDTASLQTRTPKNKFAGQTTETGNSPHVTAHQIVAMLLVGLGLLGFSARHRRDVV